MPHPGNRVTVHYTGKLEDGTVFDSSVGRDPLVFTVGRGEVIPGFDRAVKGMKVGERKTVTIPPVDGYGDYQKAFVIDTTRSEIPPDIVLELGAELTLHLDDGGQVPVRVTALDETRVTLDGNHPLSGKVLTFEIELVSVG